MNLNSILIGTDDPGRLIAYYTKLLGEPAWNMEGYVGWMIGSGAITMGSSSGISTHRSDCAAVAQPALVAQIAADVTTPRHTVR